GLRVCSRRPKQGVWNCGLRVPDTFFPEGQNKGSGTVVVEFQTPCFGLLEQTLTFPRCPWLRPVGEVGRWLPRAWRRNRPPLRAPGRRGRGSPCKGTACTRPALAQPAPGR